MSSGPQEQAEPGAAAGSYRLAQPALARIEHECAKYPATQRQSAVLAALTIAQDQFGWLPLAVLEEVAAILGMAPVAVYEVASFYHMFKLVPGGRYTINLCTGLPCALAGAQAAARHLQARLGVGLGAMTPDGRYALVEGECMGACGDAPVLLVNNKTMCSFMDSDRLDALLQALEAQPAADRVGQLARQWSSA